MLNAWQTLACLLGYKDKWDTTLAFKEFTVYHHLARQLFQLWVGKLSTLTAVFWGKHFFLFFFLFWPYHVDCGILVSWLEIEPRSSQSPNHGTARESPFFFFFFISVSRGCSGSLRHGFQALVLHIYDTSALSPHSFPWTGTFSSRTLERWSFSAWNEHIWVKTSFKEPKSEIKPEKQKIKIWFSSSRIIWNSIIFSACQR